MPVGGCPLRSEDPCRATPTAMAVVARQRCRQALRATKNRAHVFRGAPRSPRLYSLDAAVASTSTVSTAENIPATPRQISLHKLGLRACPQQQRGTQHASPPGRARDGRAGCLCERPVRFRRSTDPIKRHWKAPAGRTGVIGRDAPARLTGLGRTAPLHARRAAAPRHVPGPQPAPRGAATRPRKPPFARQPQIHLHSNMGACSSRSSTPASQPPLACVVAPPPAHPGSGSCQAGAAAPPPLPPAHARPPRPPAAPAGLPGHRAPQAGHPEAGSGGGRGQAAHAGPAQCWRPERQHDRWGGPAGDAGPEPGGRRHREDAAARKTCTCARMTDESRHSTAAHAPPPQASPWASATTPPPSGSLPPASATRTQPSPQAQRCARDSVQDGRRGRRG